MESHLEYNISRRVIIYQVLRSETLKKRFAKKKANAASDACFHWVYT